MKNALVKTKHIRSTPVGLVINKNISFAEYLDFGLKLSAADKAIHWFIGDWLLFGEQNKYGDKYAKAIERTGFAYNTIRHDKAVAKKFELVRRRTNLLWAHHEMVSSLPEKEQDKFLNLAEKHNWTLAKLRGALNKYKHKQLSAGGERIKNSKVIYGDFREVCKRFKDESIDCVFTDPPYAKEYLYLWSALSKTAARILKPTGFCICYSGHFHLPEVYDRLREHLTYWWECAAVHPASGQFVRPRNLNTYFKPILIFVKPPVVNIEPSTSDIIIRKTPKEKDLHEWQQPVSEAEEIIRRFTDKGDIILDPMAGSGTIPLAAKRTGRKYLAIDNDKTNVSIIKKRLRKQ